MPSKGTLSRLLQVFASQGFQNRLSIGGQSDLDAQATQLKYIFQPSGRERPRAELAQSPSRGITALQIMGCC
eukprot:9501148-Pyramimonas_sp.AAC.1